MNTEAIEKLLRKAPHNTAPAGLRNTLKSDIDLPSASARTLEHRESGSWLRRWIPALGFAVWFLGCVIVLGVQASRIAELKERARASEAARRASASLLTGANETPSASTTEIEQLRKDLADLARLRGEVERLRAELAELPKLQTENAQLRLTLKAQVPPGPKPEEDYFAQQQGRAARIVCVNHLKQLCLAARIWANDSKSDALPKNVESLKPYLKSAEKMLFCPSDGTTPYQVLSPGASENHPLVVFVRCTIHNNVGLVDGSVQQLSPSHKLVQRDAEWFIER